MMMEEPARHMMGGMMNSPMTQGAMIPSWRKAPTKVMVFQCPKGARPISLWPRAAHPRRGAMLVLAQVSSMKTSRLGSMLP